MCLTIQWKLPAMIFGSVEERKIWEFGTQRDTKLNLFLLPFYLFFIFYRRLTFLFNYYDYFTYWYDRLARSYHTPVAIHFWHIPVAICSIPLFLNSASWIIMNFFTFQAFVLNWFSPPFFVNWSSCWKNLDGCGPFEHPKGCMILLLWASRWFSVLTW